MYTTDQEVSLKEKRKTLKKKETVKSENFDHIVELENILTEGLKIKNSCLELYSKKSMKDLSDAIIDIEFFCSKIKSILN